MKMPVGQIIGSLARSELEAVKRKTASVGFLIAATGFLFLAAFFAFLALFLWLREYFEPWQAASIVVGALVACALLMLLVSKLLGRRHTRSFEGSNARLSVMIDEASTKLKKEDITASAVGTALAVGFAIGRKISK